MLVTTAYKAFIPLFLMVPPPSKNLAVIQSFRLSSTNGLQTQQVIFEDPIFIVWCMEVRQIHHVH
ncbi:MAG: hypothetical protein EB086_12795 [Rhodobacteraceae bacterium]|nr:hypothetical protein [Paracoccaceae bacterium]